MALAYVCKLVYKIQATERSECVGLANLVHMELNTASPGEIACICLHCRWSLANGLPPTKNDIERYTLKGLTLREDIRQRVDNTRQTCVNSTPVRNGINIMLNSNRGNSLFPGVPETPNANGVDDSTSCPQDTMEDFWNHRDPKWIAENLYSMELLDLSKALYLTGTHTLNLPESPQGHMYLQEFEDREVWSWLPISTLPPPLPSPGQNESFFLSSKSATLLRRAGALFQRDGKARFITLTYRQSVCQVVSKRHLDNFIKALKRTDKNIEYFWVAELQKRGVIHYHLATNNIHIRVDWLRKTWTRISGQNVEPDIRLVDNPSNYMAKYMSKGGDILQPQPICGKRVGFSRTLRKRLKPISICREAMAWDEAKSLLSTLPERHEIMYVTDSAVICEKT